MAKLNAPKSELLIDDNLSSYNVPENWEWVTLDSGFAQCLDKFRKPINSDERSKRSGEVPYYGATGQVGWIDNFLTKEELVLVGEDGAPFFDSLKNKAYIINGPAWVNNHAHILKSYFGHVGNIYLMHYLNQFNFHGYVNGTTRLKLTQAKMKVIPIPLPPFPEQQRIVNRIESLFEKIDKAQDLIEEAREGFEKRKEGILAKAFRGELTAKWRKEHMLTLNSWKTVKSGDLFEYVTSGSRGWAKYYSTSGSVFIRTGNLKRDTIELDFNDIQYVDLPINVEGKRSKVKKNDILISITADVGRVGYVRDCEFEAYINQHVALARPIKEVCSEYIAWYLISSHGISQLKNKERGTTKIGLGLDDIRTLMVKLPKIEEQIKIVEIINHLIGEENKAYELTGIEEQIKLLKKSILAKAFRGELGTNDPSEEPAINLLNDILTNKIKK